MEKDGKKNDESCMASVDMIKGAFVDKEMSFGGRCFFFLAGVVILPFEAVKVGLEAVGVDFDDGPSDSLPYDL